MVISRPSTRNEDQMSAHMNRGDQVAVDGGIESTTPDLTPAEYRATVKQLFREHNRALVNFLLTRVRSKAEAMDLAQEAYVRLLQLDHPGAIGFLRGYLFRIAANLSVDSIRARIPRERAAVELFEELGDSDEIEHRAILHEEFDIVCAALEQLPKKCQKAFLLNVVEGHSHAETARAVGCNERMVRYHISRALAHCRKELAQLSKHTELPNHDGES
jgi:RNA polymerase sigma factor (sigma-70 family)